MTGGAGFIGSHLAERLLANGCEVVCLDNFNDYYDPDIKKSNIEGALLNSRYTLVTGDIRDCETLDKLFADGFDVVAHMAACAGVRASIERPDFYQKVNVVGTSNLLERCRMFKVPKFIFASSSSVYGGRTKVPFRENDDVSRPISPYAASKIAGELLCYTYHHLFGINMHLLRFFTVYGPRQRPEMAIHLFASRMLRGEPLVVFGDGSSSRDYTYVDDVVDGVMASIGQCRGFEVFNIGGSNTTSLNELISMISTRLKINPEIEKRGEQPGDAPVTFADIDRAHNSLGYEPKVGIETGIDRFCTWLEEQERSEEWDDPQISVIPK